MSKLTVIIPARHELYLKQTVDDLFTKAGDIELIVILDGYWPQPQSVPQDNPRLTLIHRDRRGMRAAINSAVAIAKGEYIMKVDAHCMFASGFDEVLKADCDGDWIVIPRRYSLDVDEWKVKTDRPMIDYEYLGWPWSDKSTHGSKVGLHARAWDERAKRRAELLLDENMSFQGSCWFMSTNHFRKRIGKMQEEGYGTFIGEPQELGLKTWLGGGRVMTNKKTWYAHLWKGEVYRKRHQEQIGIPYTRIGAGELKNGNAYSVDYWINNRWEGRQHDISWLVEHFWPVPTWPEEREAWIHSPTS